MGGIRRRAGKKKGNNVKNKREAGQPGNYKDIVRENEMYTKFFAKQVSAKNCHAFLLMQRNCQSKS